MKTVLKHYLYKSLPVIFSIIGILSLSLSKGNSLQQDESRDSIRLLLQTRNHEGKIEVRDSLFKAQETAIIVVDMWNKHWCKAYTKKMENIVPDMNRFLEAARKLNIQIIFAPSETKAFYQTAPQYTILGQFPFHPLKKVRDYNPFLPPWAKTGGCECGPDRPCKSRQVWTRQNDSLNIGMKDLVTDNVQKMYNFFKEKGIKNLLYTGGASNMCVTVTRPFSVIPMTRYGFNCIVVRDMVLAISGNGYDPDLKKKIPSFTPEYGSQKVIEHIEQYVVPTISANQILRQAGSSYPVELSRAGSWEVLFDSVQVSRYVPRGPSVRFRQLCYDYNWVGRTMSDLPKKFTRASAEEYAELSKNTNMDAVLVLAVPHHGYTTYNSRVGERFPALKEDWFGRVVQELHKRDISAFGYITLGTNWKFMRDHIGQPYVRSLMKKNGVVENTHGLCLNAPGYIELVSEYTREVLQSYPVDALRYDMFFGPEKCDCQGCRSLYKRLYHEDFTNWDDITLKHPNRSKLFNIATLNHVGNELLKVCKAVKPQVEIWHNPINTYSEADVNLGRKYDIAYIEYGDPFRLLSLKGILDKNSVIVGQTLTSPIRNLILALGARCYQYIRVNQETALPDKRSWLDNDLKGFYKMVSEVQPYLEDATLPGNIGIIFSENTRYHLPGLDRKPYMEACRKITMNYLDNSLPLHFINVLDLDKKDLSHYKLLYLPRTSGLSKDQIDRLRYYVKNGGTVMVLGDALLYDEKGKKMSTFSLSTEMGIKVERVLVEKDTLLIGRRGLELNSDNRFIRTADSSAIVTDLLKVKAKKGNTLLSMRYQNEKIPLVHTNRFGKGLFIYVATSGDEMLTRSVADYFTGAIPVTVEGNKQVVLARKDQHNRWILHLIGDGDYEIRIDRNFAPVSRVSGKYPAQGWSSRENRDGNTFVIRIQGNAKNRLLVLE